MRKDPALENRRRVEDATVAAVKRYEPGFYAGRVDVFLPNDAWRRSGDQPDEWKRVAARVVEHVGPGRRQRRHDASRAACARPRHACESTSMREEESTLCN